MSRLSIPATVEASPAPSRPLLEAVRTQLGSVPNLFRLLGQSPAALAGYLGLSGALGKAKLDLRTRERIAMTVAELNGCDYCLKAHTYLGKNLARLDDAELTADRQARSSDDRAAAALVFARAVVKKRGHVSGDDLAAVRAAGFDDGEVLEIVASVVLDTLTNYVNTVAETEIDFPVVRHDPGAAHAA
jgi:uncharacterized peroxidase-related enzyme